MTYDVYDAMNDIKTIEDGAETIIIKEVYREGYNIYGAVEFPNAIVEHSVLTGEITVINYNVLQAARILGDNLNDLLPENVDTSDIDETVNDVLDGLAALIASDKRKTIDKSKIIGFMLNERR